MRCDVTGGGGGGDDDGSGGDEYVAALREAMEVIELDLCRTFPGHAYIDSDAGQRTLRCGTDALPALRVH